MTDPLDVLRAPAQPADPDPGFAAWLRAKVARALHVPVPHEGATTMSEPNTPTGPPVGVVPYLMVTDGHAALGWYAEALGAVELGERYEEGGVVGHAEMRLAGAVFYLAGGGPEPEHAEGPYDVRSSLVATVPDVDALVDRAVAAGARLERPASNQPYGRTAVVHDPYGHRWMLQSPVPATVPSSGTGPEAARAGDLAYLYLRTPDAERAASFYAAVLGWEVGPGSGPDYRQVGGQSLSMGIEGGVEDSTAVCCWQVDDVDAAAERARAAGGTVGEARDEPWGRIADGVDDQGQQFALFAPPAGEPAGPRLAVNGSRQGDPSYLTMAVPDRAAAMAFYGTVLGWRAEGEDDPEDVHPMVGVTDRGVDRPQVLPMWKVDDVAAAAARVRAAGGTAEAPERKPYGVTAMCTDDQGMRFWLGDT